MRLTILKFRRIREDLNNKLDWKYLFIKPIKDKFLLYLNLFEKTVNYPCRLTEGKHDWMFKRIIGSLSNKKTNLVEIIDQRRKFEWVLLLKRLIQQPVLPA